MMVSLAVLAVALTVVGVVFSVTTKTVSQAAAISETHARVRQFMLQLEEDLKHVDPTRSELIIIGGVQRGALNADDLSAGASYRVLTGNPDDVASGYDPRLSPDVDPEYSNPRTDLLGFFTARPTVSKAPPTSPADNPYVLGGRFAPVYVAYGHTALVDARENSPGDWSVDESSLRHIFVAGGSNTMSTIPVSRWHLGRRTLIVKEADAAQFAALNFSDTAFRPFRRCLPANNDQGADIITLSFERHLAAFSSPTWLFTTAYTQPAFAIQWAQSMIFGSGAGAGVSNRHFATVIAEPPAALRSNLGVHMLPACAWFQVEFLMPEDPRNSIDYYDPLPPGAPGRNQRDDMPLWTEVPAGETYVFAPDTQFNRDLIVRDGTRVPFYRSMDQRTLDSQVDVTKKRIRTWPYGIRVTVRVFDPLGRLDEPIVRSLIHRFE